MISGKRAQVTVFIIIGIIVIAAAALFFYFRSTTIEPTKIVEPEAMPVKNFVEDCMYRIAKDGITVLGLNGGYINFPPEIQNNPLSYLSLGPTPSNPFWWYDGVTNIPTEDSIKQQISEHVTNQLRTCLNDFEDFEDIYTIEEKGEIITRIFLNEEDVTIEVNYPIDIISTINTTKTDLVDYRITLPIRLKKAYQLANAIMERENIEGFIEEKTWDLMVLDHEENIPVQHYAFGAKDWYISDIKQTLKELLRRNMQFIKIAGTNYNGQSYIPIPPEYSQTQTFDESYFNYHYVWTVMENPPEDMRVAFTYDDISPAFDMNIYARPSRNGKITPNVQQGFDRLRDFVLPIWKVTYDISFPVLVTVRDDRSSSHEEFSFIFAFKANIDHNQPARTNLATSVYRTPDRDTNEEYCSELENEITVYTTDKITDIPVPDINLTLTCGGFNCPIGITEWFGFGAEAGLTASFPYCVQAIIKGAAEGYAESQEIIQTNIAGEEYTLYMTPVKEITDYEVVKHTFQNGFVNPAE